MSSASPSQGRQTPSTTQEPKIQHSFDGDVKILNSTFDSRMEIRKTLGNLQQLLQRQEGRNVQIAADIKLRIAGPDAKEHSYTVTINDSKLDVDAFLKQFPAASKAPPNARTASSPVTAHANGQRGSSARAETRAADGDDDDVIEVRPFKKARTETSDAPFSTPTPRSKDTDGLLRETLALLKQRGSGDALEFMKQWHTEWVKQGGWLFDTLNKGDKLARDNHTAAMNRLGSVQDVLGQSMNAASAATMTELASISKLIPWLEHCRKTGADKVQAREEKWRTSSATFHDQSRRDREMAEKRLEAELQKQRALLVKIAEANGVDVDEDEKSDEREGREASLGAQLTAELNMEANRADENGKKPSDRRETINIDDDDDDDDDSNK